MKTSSLVLATVACLLGASSLHAQTTVTTRNTNGRKTTTTFNSRRLTAAQQSRVANAPVAIGPRTDGVIPRAIRSGNALQMINPAAPAEYGDGRDVTRHEVDDPFQRPQGIKLYAVEF